MLSARWDLSIPWVFLPPFMFVVQLRFPSNAVDRCLQLHVSRHPEWNQTRIIQDLTILPEIKRSEEGNTALFLEQLFRMVAQHSFPCLSFPPAESLSIWYLARMSVLGMHPLFIRLLPNLSKHPWDIFKRPPAYIKKVCQKQAVSFHPNKMCADARLTLFVISRRL